MFYNIRIKHINKCNCLNKLLYLCAINLNKRIMKKQKSVWKGRMIISSIVSATLVSLLVIGLLSVEKIIMLPLLLLIVWGLYFLFCLYKFLTTKY